MRFNFLSLAGILAAGLGFSDAKAQDVSLTLGAYDATTLNRLSNVEFYIDTDQDGIMDEGPWYTNMNGWVGDQVVGIENPQVPNYLAEQFVSLNIWGNATSSSLEAHLSRERTNKTAIMQPVSVGVYDLRGRQLALEHEVQNGESITFDQGLASGAYLLRINDQNQTTTKKFISQGNNSVKEIQVVFDQAEEKVRIPETQSAVDIYANLEGFNELIATEWVDANGSPYTFDYGLTPSTSISKTLFGDAWDLLNENALIGGTVNVMNASGETFTAPVDSSFTVDYNIEDVSENIKIWFEHPDMSASGVLYDQDGLVVRDRIAQAANFITSTPTDTMTVAANHPLLEQAVRYQGVDNVWNNDSNWHGLLLNPYGLTTRGEDRAGEDGAWTLKGLTQEYDISTGTVGSTISQSDIDDITNLLNYKQSLFTQPNGTQIANVNVEIMGPPNGGLDCAYLFIDNTTGPGNSPYTQEGYLEVFSSYTPSGEPIGTKSEELFGEELTDVGGSLGVAIYPDGTLKDVGKAAFNAHYLFDDGTQFN